MRTATGDVPVLRQQLTAQQIAGVFAEVVPSEMRNAFPAPGVTTFEYGAPAGRVAVKFERNGGQVRAMVRPAEKAGEEEGEAIELASAAEMLHEYMHGPPGKLNPGTPPTPAATGIPMGSQSGIPMDCSPDDRVRGPARCGEGHPVPRASRDGEARGTRRGLAAREGRSHPRGLGEGARGRSVPVPRPRIRGPRWTQLLNFMLDRKASDLHVSSDTTPIIRVDGDMTPIEGYPPLAPGRLKDMLFSIAPEKNREQWLSIKDTDFAYETPARPLPGERLRGPQGHRRGDAADPQQDPHGGGDGPAAGGPGPLLPQQGPGAGDRAHRLGKVHHPRGDDRPHQPQPGRPHHHHRGPDRVRAPQQAVPREPAGDRRAHQLVQARPARGAARRPGHRPGGRDARPRDHRHRHRDRGDRPPGLRHAAHQHRAHRRSTASSTSSPPTGRSRSGRCSPSRLKGVIAQTLCKKIGGGRVAALEILIATPARRQPHPRGQDLPDPLDDADRQGRRACRPSTTPCSTW